MRFYIFILTVLFSLALNAQKQVHVPNVITNNALTYNQYQSDNFVVFYGDLMPSTYNPATTIEALEKAYCYYTDTLNYQATLANDAPYKFIILIDESWSASPSPNTATPNTTRNFDSVVDGVWLEFNTAVNYNLFLLAHETVHLLQRLSPIIYPPAGEPLAYSSLEETHAEYMAYQVYPTQNPDYLARQDKNRESWLRQNVYFRYFLLFYFQEKIGSLGINNLYNNLHFLEHPIKGYARIFNKTVEYMNNAFTEYAMRTVNFDFIQRTHWEAPLNLYQRNGILQANYDNTTKWYNVPATNFSTSIVPEAYGFNVHEILTYNSSNIALTFESTKLNDPLAGNKFGFVAIKNNQARYSPIYSETSTNVNFDVNPDERVFLVVVGAPKEFVYVNSGDLNNAIYDYPYRYKVNLQTNCLQFLTPCNDTDPCTSNDVYDANCQCNGTLTNDSPFQILYVSVNKNLEGWQLFQNQTITLTQGQRLSLTWTGNTNNETWYAPDGSVLSTNLVLYLNNMQPTQTGIYNLVVFDELGCSSDTVSINIEVICANFGLPCNDANALTTNDIYNQDCFCVGTTGFTLKIKAMLEGFTLPNNLMTKSLNLSNLIPSQQPFNTSPWFYNGDEFFTQLPNNAVDWVLLKIYDINNNLLDTQAAIVFNDGNIHNVIDGNNYVQFLVQPSQAAYLSIHHKSHLAVVANIQNLTQNSTVDFTVQGTALGINQTKKINGSIQTLLSGDFDANGLINNLDYNIWGRNNSAVNEYFLQDADGNAIINNNDFNLWSQNKSKVGDALIQY